MKTKTATIEHYTMRGCSWYATDVIYRGRRLHHIDKQDLSRSEQVNSAKNWAISNGFTHVKINHIS